MKSLSESFQESLNEAVKFNTKAKQITIGDIKLASLEHLSGKTLDVIETETVQMASGPQNHYIVELDGKDYTIRNEWVTKVNEAQEVVTESVELQPLNESAITDLVSNLSKDQMELLVGAIGAVGLIGSAAVTSKLVNFLKKKGGNVAKGVIDSLESMGSAAGSVTQNK